MAGRLCFEFARSFYFSSQRPEAQFEILFEKRSGL